MEKCNPLTHLAFKGLNLENYHW